MPNGDPDLAGPLRALVRLAPSSARWAEQLLISGLDELLTAAPALLEVDAVALMLLLNTDDSRETSDSGVTSDSRVTSDSQVAGDLRVAGASGDLAAALDAQSPLGNGPSLACVRRSRPVAVTDLARSADYQPLWHAVGSGGVRAVLSTPVTVAGNIAGTLDAVCRRPHHWPPPQVRAVQAYARIIAVTLVSVATAMNADAVSDRLFTQLDLDAGSDRDSAAG